MLGIILWLSFSVKAFAVLTVIPDLTPDDFRCKGDSAVHPVCRWNNHEYCDCRGGGLPQAGIDPQLLNLLNELQRRFNKPVIVNSGYRCPQHNSYIAAELYNWTDDCGNPGNPYEVSTQSRHMMGAAADFYVQDYELNPVEVIDTILSIQGLNQQSPEVRIYWVNQKKRDGSYSTDYYHYRAYSTPQWWIHPYAPQEGRDLDNRHYSGVYIHIHHRVNFDESSCQPCYDN
ncbi:MAG: D-Ala-D-Ala carboxypeptidase family metallohydrolase [bacterium]